MSKLFPFQQASDITAAAWVTNSLQGFATNVVSIVPAGFPAYARIYHPAWRTQNNARSQVRWSEMAQANNRVAHRAMQWPSILGSYDFSQQHLQSATSDILLEQPNEGSLPPEMARLLWQVLAHHTTTAATCWFAVWEGFGCLTKEV